MSFLAKKPPPPAPAPVKGKFSREQRYQHDMARFKKNLTKQFDSWWSVILRIADGDASKIRYLFEEATHVELALALASKDIVI